ncbi:hypothetical protein GCM10027059_19630 [Myceligenerans halotolerans]
MSTGGLVPARALARLSDEEQAVICCRVHDLPGTDANITVTRVAGRLESVVHAIETSPIVLPTVAPSYTIVRHGQHDVLATDCGTDAATAERWLTALRIAQVTPWTCDAEDFEHVKNWILAHVPAEGLFIATTEHGTGIGIGGHAGLGVVMLTGTRLIANPGYSTSVTRLHDQIARWRRAGAPYTEQLPAALFRQGHGYRVRFVVPGKEAQR